MSSNEKQKAVHTIEFPITKVEGYHKPSDAFDRRFLYMNRIHNQLVKEAQRRIDQLYRNRHYTNLLQKYGRIKNDKTRKEELKQIQNELIDIRKKYDLEGKYSFQKYVKKQGEKYKNYIQSKQYYKEAEKIWVGVEAVLYGKGKNLHFRKINEMTTISQSDISNGIRFDITTCKGAWGKKNDKKHLLHFDVKINWNDEYVIDSVIGNTIKYYEIKRRIFKDGYHYYLVLVLDGKAPKKARQNYIKGTTGIDLGVSSVACVSNNKVILEELAPKVKEYEKQLKDISKKMERSLRINNPDNFNSDGTPKKGQHTWNTSKNYCRLNWKYNAINRAKTEYTRSNHKRIINSILDYSKEIYLEPMKFNSLAKKSKNTERENTVSEIVQKNGTVKQVYKYKKKKRFGKSISMRSPGLFQSLLREKASQEKIPLFEINTAKFKASQYHHDINEFIKPKLSERSKTVGGYKVQRDLYSAFLISNSNTTLESADIDRCNEKFEHFVEMQNELIESMKKQNISFKQCFGF